MISSHHHHCRCCHHLTFSRSTPFQLLKWYFAVVRVPRFRYLHLHSPFSPFVFTILYKVIVQIAFSVYYLYLTTISLGSASVVFETFLFSSFRYFFRSLACSFPQSFHLSRFPLSVWNWDKRRDCFELQLAFCSTKLRFFFLRFLQFSCSLIDAENWAVYFIVSA